MRANTGILSLLALLLMSATGCSPAGRPKEATPAVAVPRRDLLGDPLPLGALARLGTTRFRHPGGITAMAVSSDGRRVATGGPSGTVCVWEAASGRGIWTAEIPGGMTAALAFSADGKSLSVAARSGSVSILDAETGAESRQWGGNERDIRSIEFSPDATLAAFCTDDGLVRLRSTDSGRAIREFRAPERDTLQVAFSPDGDKLLLGGRGPLRLWSLSNGAAPFAPGDARGYEVAWSPAGDLVASFELGGPLRLRDPHGLREMRGVKDETRTCSSMRFSPDGKYLVGAGSNGIRVWEAGTGSLVMRAEPLRCAFGPIAFLRASTLLFASGSAVREWPFEHDSPSPPTGHLAAVSSVLFSTDGRTLLTGSRDGAIRRWSAETGKSLACVESGGSSVESLALSPDGRSLASVGSDARAVQRWDAETMAPSGSLSDKEWKDAVNQRAVAISPDGTEIASAGDDSFIRRWRVATGERLPSLALPGRTGATRIAFSPQGNALAVICSDECVYLCHLPGGEPMLFLKARRGPFMDFAFSPDGRLLALTGLSGPLLVAEVGSAKVVRKIGRADPGANCIAISPDGSSLAAGGNDGEVRVFNLETGAEICSLQGHAARVGSVAFSPDGKRLASASDDTTVLVWDLARPR